MISPLSYATPRFVPPDALPLPAAIPATWVDALENKLKIPMNRYFLLSAIHVFFSDFYIVYKIVHNRVR